MPDDFTLSNARRFHSAQRQTISLCPTPDDFTLSNARRFNSVQRQTISLCPTPDYFTLSNARLFYSVQRQTILLVKGDPLGTKGLRLLQTFVSALQKMFQQSDQKLELSG